MTFAFGGNQSTLDPHGPIARSIADHGWWLLLITGQLPARVPESRGLRRLSPLDHACRLITYGLLLFSYLRWCKRHAPLRACVVAVQFALHPQLRERK